VSPAARYPHRAQRRHACRELRHAGRAGRGPPRAAARARDMQRLHEPEPKARAHEMQDQCEPEPRGARP